VRTVALSHRETYWRQDQPGADLRLAELLGLGVEVVGQLPDRAEIGLLSALAQAGALEVLKLPPAENPGHVLVRSQRVKKQALRATIWHSLDGCQTQQHRWECG
jgi:hypothetical protein